MKIVRDGESKNGSRKPKKGISKFMGLAQRPISLKGKDVVIGLGSRNDLAKNPWE